MDKHVTVEGSTITFVIQDGPISEAGINGCQVDVLGKVFKLILESFNAKLPCPETTAAIQHVDACLTWLDKRTKRRTRGGIEGKNIELTTEPVKR